ncbi:MAG: hypothetical protein ACRDGD_03490 [Candidatus Limnocylindria bacterium]
MTLGEAISSRRAAVLAVTPAVEAILFAVGAATLYWITGPEQRGDVWPPLAQAFLDGQIHLDQDRPWLELIPRPGGGQYSPMPPMPAVLIAPLVAIAGEVPGNVYASIIGGANVGLVFWLLLGWQVAPSPRRWLTLGFAGTTHWWVAGMAGPHHFAQVSGVLFTLLALNLAVRRRWPIAGGLLLGMAAASRLPMGLALPVILCLYGGGWRPHRSWGLVVGGLALPALAVAGYNVARFGSPFDFGYARIPSGEDGLVTDEPWFTEGLLSLSYIPRHLEVIFLATFDYVREPPFLKPSMSGASLLLTAPFLFGSLLARGRWVGLLWLGVALVMTPNLLHGSWGFAQFGYRFILDAVPLVMLLLGIVFRERIGWLAISAIVFGVAVHAYAIWVINVLGFVT